MTKIVLITGAFDLIHPGHIQLLKTAKSIASSCNGYVLCLVNSDHMVRTTKGENRPIRNISDRLLDIYRQNILDINDFVLSFSSEDELVSYCQTYNPIRLLGSDYIGKPIVGSEYCKCILFVERTNDSTTKKKIQSITNW